MGGYERMGAGAPFATPCLPPLSTKGWGVGR